VEAGVDPGLRARPARLLDGVVGRLLDTARGVVAVERARRPIEMLRSGAHQAPLRPDAPNPAISRSTITIRRAGSRWAR
jgi:hypothetical protein